MDINYNEYLLILILFTFGLAIGGVLPNREKNKLELRQIISNAVICGFMGIVGGAVAIYTLPYKDHTIIIASGIIFSIISGLFSNEDIKNFFRNTIRLIISIRFKK